MQLGTEAGPVLDGLSRGQVAVLALLDGTHTRRQLYAAAARHGETPEVVDRLLGVLDGLDVLERPTETRLRTWLRAQRRVLVSGGGDLADAVTAALRAADLARVRQGWWAVDDPDPAVRDDHGFGDRQPDLVVLTATLALDPSLGDPWSRHGVDHLAVVDAGPQVRIGPLVRPGATDAPCLRCVELHRCDRDPARAAVLAQACGPEFSLLAGGTLGPGGHGGPRRALLTAAAAITALVAEAHLDGQWLPAGVTVELTQPWPRLDHRRWSRHPCCPGHRVSGTPVTPARETMAG